MRRLRSGPGAVLGGADAVGSGACGAAVGEVVVDAGATEGVGVGVAGAGLPGAGAGRVLADRVVTGVVAAVVVPPDRLARTTTVATIPVSTRAETTPRAKSQPRPRPGGRPAGGSGVAQESTGGGTARA